MIIIIIRLLPSHLHYPPFLWNFSNEDQFSMKGVVQKENIRRYLSNLAINGHPQELGADSTKIISASGAHSKITCNNMPLASRPKEYLISRHQILLEDGPERHIKYVR